jgi:GNAT superfamily N-acetyltransferase
MKIIEYNNAYEEDVKDLLVELQEYIVAIDDWHLNIITPEFREKYFEKTCKECLVGEGKIFLAIDEYDKAIGLISGNVVERDEYDKYDYICPKTGDITELIVSKNARRGGVGEMLLNRMEDYYKSIGCEYCHIDVFEPNEMGKQFYNKHNYATRMRSLSKKL